jgi:hypothetical protein
MHDAAKETAAGLSWSDSLDAIDWIEVETKPLPSSAAM